MGRARGKGAANGMASDGTSLSSERNLRAEEDDKGAVGDVYVPHSIAILPPS